MSDKMVQFTVHFSIQEGRFSEFKRVAREMCVLTADEPGTLAYDFFLSDNHQSGRLCEKYVDADAVNAHMNGPVVQKLVPELLQSGNVDQFDVNGDPGPEAAAMLKTFGATIFKPWQA